MSRRALNEQLQQRDVFKSPQQVRDYLVLKLGSVGIGEAFEILYSQSCQHGREFIGLSASKHPEFPSWRAVAR